MTHQEEISGLRIGDLVEKLRGARSGALAIITDLCMEDYYHFNPWIRIAYVDGIGGYEWVHREGLKILLEE